jgi:arylsulfatase A-like enzyme
MSKHPSRRTFIQGAAVAPFLASTGLPGAEEPKPNFIWLTWEDIGPHLHCCGDEYSTTPNFDRLAKRGCIYKNVWASAPVCAPARTAIVTGVSPTSTGAEHMRSMTRMPSGWKMFPGYLREAGYYCTNNGKEDYNVEKPEGTWDVSQGGNGGAPGAYSPQGGHWRNRKPGQPFFAVFNNITTHESQIFKSATNKNIIHDPAQARLPAFHPDIPEVRRDWAQYHDLLAAEDAQHVVRLDELEQDGLLADTIIVVTSDHGCGMPRYKRFPYDSGLHVPMILVFPEKFRHLAPPDYVPGGHSDQLVGTIDLGPTMLSLAGLKPPAFQQGKAFAGVHQAPPRDFLFGFRGRMDERYDLMRSTRDKRFIYIRNYNPHKIYGQHVSYMWSLPSTPVWEQMYKDGKLKAPQTYFWETKPAEELYDLQADPDEVQNLASSGHHRATLERFRKAHHANELEVKDLGLLPEGEIHQRAKGSTPYEMGHDPIQYPFDKILAAADLATSMQPGVTGKLQSAMQNADSGVRYWGTMGALMRGTGEVARLRPAMLKALTDISPHVRIAAAEALGRYGSVQDVKSAMTVLMKLANAQETNAYIAIHALNAIDAIGRKAAPWKTEIAALPTVDPKSPARVNSEYTPRLIERLQQTL